MIDLKQSTAITWPILVVDTNGDGVVGLVSADFTKRIKKAGGAWANLTVTITEEENGWYSLPLTTAHTDTLGTLQITLTHASAKATNLLFIIRARSTDDLLYDAAAVADSFLGRNVNGGSSTGRTVKQALHFLRNRWAIVAGTLTVYDTDDSTPSWTAPVTSDVAANPITGVDPG